VSPTLTSTRPCRRCGEPFPDFGLRGPYTRMTCEACQRKRDVRQSAIRAKAKITEAVRRAVIARDGHVCRYCGGAVVEGSGGKYPKRDRLELDHVIPVSLRGTSTVENLVVCCLLCNRRKSNREAVT
jgi:5-methylcytosine-specific restriction endonuclease McrA